MIEAGKENSPTGIKLSKGLEYLARETKTDPGQVLQDQMKSRIRSLSYNLVNAKQNPKRNNTEVKDIERKITRLEARSGYSSKQSIRDAERSHRQQLYWSIQSQIVELIEEGKYNTTQGQNLRKRSSQLAKELNIRADSELKSYADSRISTLVWEVYCEKERSNPDKKKITALETLNDKLRLLIKGQAWVARKIDLAISYGTEPETEEFLKEMKEKHDTNIGELDKYLLQN
jgi:hypothetical protein